MSRDNIDNTLFRVKIACMTHINPMAERIVYDSVAWYVETGRATITWIKALARLRCYKGLITKALSKDTSTDGVISTITKLITI